MGGLSLLELLLAMVLLTIVMSLLYGSIAQVSSGVGVLKAGQETAQMSRLLLRIISDDLASASYFSQFVQADGAASGLILTADNLDGKSFSKVVFHADAPVRFYRGVNARADPHMHELAYWVEPASEVGKLVLKRREDFYLDDDMEAGGVTAVIGEDIRTFQVEVLATATGREDWLDNWNSSQRSEEPMPVAIRIRLGVGGAGPRVSEENIVINLDTSMEIKP